MSTKEDQINVPGLPVFLQRNVSSDILDMTPQYESYYKNAGIII